MTYCIAWRTKRTAFLVADAASTKSAAPRTPHSTFGELHPYNRGLSVEESAFKLYKWKNLGVTFAGDANGIRQYVYALDKHLSIGVPALAALQVAQDEFGGSSNGSFEGVAATHFFGRPRLLRLDRRGRWNFVKKDCAIHLGSPSPSFKEFINDAISEVVSDELPPLAQLACVLATCQSLTVHHYLMENHAGGAFSGMMIDKDGTQWQPDIAYLLLNPPDMTTIKEAPRETRNSHYISCVIRDDILFVGSPLVPGTVAFLSPKGPWSPDEARGRVARAFPEAHIARSQCLFEFVAVMSKQKPISAVVEMKGKASSNHLRMAISKREGGEALTSDMSKHLGTILRGEGPELDRPRLFFCSAEPLAHRAP